MAHTQKREVARGTIDPRRPELRQTIVRMDAETFEEIRERAVREKTSFSEQVRLLLEWGLETAGGHEPDDGGHRP